MECCRCNEINHIHGREGQDYVSSHLEELAVNDSEWTVLYRCPVTSIFWKLSYPYPEAHGGGPPDFDQITEKEAMNEFNY